MIPQEKFELLVDELEGFIDDEAIAIREGNWSYLAELLRKKEIHLKAIGGLKPQVNEHLGDLPHQIERIKAKEAIASRLMAEKMEEAREEQAHIQEAKLRLHQMRQHAHMQSYQVIRGNGGLRAEA